MSFAWRASAHALATQMSHTPRSAPPPLRSARSRSASGDGLHGGTSLKGEKAHLAA